MTGTSAPRRHGPSPAVPGTALLPYPGGKRCLCHKLVQLIPPHHCYVEVFGGAASLLVAKPPSPVEVLNDIDSDLVNLFRALQNEHQFVELLGRLMLTLCSREEFRRAEALLRTRCDALDKAWAKFVSHRQSFSGKGTGRGWGFSAKRNEARRWYLAVSRLPFFHRRLAHVQIECGDWRDILRRYDRDHTFFFLDPPYYGADPTLYKHVMTDADHLELAERLLHLRGKAMVCNSISAPYQSLEAAGWRKLVLSPRRRITAKSKPDARVHTGVWFNYDPVNRVSCDLPGLSS